MTERHVQATVPEMTYESLWRQAKREKRSIKALVREAIEAYLARRAPKGEDPLLSFVGSGRLKEGNWSERKDWRN